MANLIQGSGQNTIQSTTAAAVGQWYWVHPKLRNLTFQVLHTGTSVGTSVGSTTYIEVSNDGVNVLNSKAGTVVMGNVSPLDISPACDGFTLDAHYNYVRSRVNSMTTGTVSVIASAHQDN